MNRNNVTILGAGLCGALLAIVLARRGIKVTMLERSPDPRTTEAVGGRSINLAMAARGIRGLKHAGVYGLVEPLLVPMKGRCVHDLDGTTQLHLYGQDESEVIYSVSRAALNRILIEAAETEYKVQIRFGQEAVTYYPDEATLRVRDVDNGNDYDVRAKPLIASDGAGSVVRRAFADTDIIGGTEDLLQHRYKELVIPGGPNGEFHLEENALHIWPRGGLC